MGISFGLKAALMPLCIDDLHTHHPLTGRRLSDHTFCGIGVGRSVSQAGQSEYVSSWAKQLAGKLAEDPSRSVRVVFNN